jgi:hypothetical protein
MGNDSLAIEDSILPGDPARDLLRGFFERSDSTVSLDCSNGLQTVNFYLRLTPCYDTGMYNLSGKSSSFIYYIHDSVTYRTDTLTQWSIHVTRLDTVADKISGTFTSVVQREIGTKLDTTFKLSGVMFDFPITVSR